MVNPPTHPGLSGHSVHDTALVPTISGNSQGSVNVNLCLNSTSTFSSQSQAFPVSGQLVSQHVDAARSRRSNFSIPFGLIRPQNTVNINIVMGQNSSININLLRSNNPSSQFARNHLSATSSNNPPNINNVYNNPTSSFLQRPLSNLDPNLEPILNRSSETNERTQFTRHHSQYASPIVTNTDYEQEIPTAIPCVRQNTVNLSPHQGSTTHPCQSIPSRNHPVSWSGMRLSSFNLSRYHFPALPISTLNSPKHQVQETSFHPQPNLPTFPESHPATKVSEQAPEPDFDCNPLTQTEVPSQNGNKAATTVPASPARRRDNSAMRRKSRQYVKYGPYPCVKCNVVFENANSYSAHFQRHYKGETPAEKKKRRESKIKKRDLHIAKSIDGVTVMPGFGDNIITDGTHGSANTSNQGKEFASHIIKEEHDSTSID
ncbi:hypothetical protein SOVF_095780 [Spinacia oleracea]|nr:hypothetical protein SOVF_095780 [Spinacia oleracea]